MAEERAMTVRLPAGIAADLALVARLDDSSATSVIQQALRLYLDRRIGETDFQAKVQAEIDHMTRARRGTVSTDEIEGR